MRTLLTLLTLLLAAACCDQRRVTYEIVDSEPIFAEYSWERVQGLIADGWDCQAEPIRNAFGTRIGERWTCERC